MKKTIEQQRAEDALKRVKNLSEKNNDDDKFKARYRAYVNRLGPSIIMNGLGQALATERAAAGSKEKRNNDEQAHHELYLSLNKWLCRTDGVYPQDKDLLETIMENSECFYLHAQAEALAWLEWHKKCCRALLPKGQCRFLKKNLLKSLDKSTRIRLVLFYTQPSTKE